MARKEEQRSLIYSCIIRRYDAFDDVPFIVAEYANPEGDFIGIAKRLVRELPSLENTFIYSCGGLNFTYLVRGQYIYCVVAVVSAGEKIPTAFLLRIEHDFSNKIYDENADLDFGWKFKGHMQVCVDRRGEIRKNKSLRPPQVLEVGTGAMEEIARVLRGKRNFEIHRSLVRMWIWKITPKLIAIIGVLLVIFFQTLDIVHVVGPWWSG